MLYERTEQGLRRFRGGLSEAVTAAMERADEDAIAAALGDECYSEEYLYGLRVEGRELVGISMAGVFEMARLLGNIEVLPGVSTERDKESYHVLVRVRDNRRRVTLLGAARQPLRKAASEKPNPRAWLVAVHKAQRDGVLRLVSGEDRQRIVEDFLARGRKQELGEAGAGAGEHHSEPPAAGQTATVAKAAEAVPPMSSMTPAEFAAGCRQKGYMTSAEVCSTLGFPDKISLVGYGLARAHEKLPDRNQSYYAGETTDILDEVDLGF